VTVAEDRPISQREIAIVNWLLKNGSRTGSLQRLEDSVPRLRVVGRCGCCCASVDFEKEDQAGARPTADANGKTPCGLQFGLILWGREGAFTGL